MCSGPPKPKLNTWLYFERKSVKKILSWHCITDLPHCEYNVEFWLQKRLEALERWERAVVKGDYENNLDSVWERKEILCLGDLTKSNYSRF